MTSGTRTGSGLTRVTVVAPDRRLDVVLPANAAVAEMLPAIVARAGEGLGDRGETHGGWRLTTETGAVVSPDASLAAQEVVDGQCLYLVPGDVQWPEVDYDDVVEAIAESSRQRARNWTSATTRATGVAGSALLLLALLALLLRAEVTAVTAGWLLLFVGSVILVAGVLIARPWSDARAGCVVGVVGVVYLFSGGLVITSPSGVPSLDVDGIDLFVGSTALVVGCVVAHVGIVWGMRVFVAGIVAGAAGMLGGGAWLLGLGTAGCAALVVAVLTGAVATFPLLAMRLGKVPVPALPRGADDVLGEVARPDPGFVRTAVLRADEILTGLLGGGSLAVVVCQVLLLRQVGAMPVWLAVVVAAALALRAQLFPTVRHKIGLLAVGATGLVGLVLVLAAPYSAGLALAATAAVILVVAGLLLAAGVRYSTREISPYVPRYADIVETMLVVSVLPLAGAVLGLYAFARGLAG